MSREGWVGGATLEKPQLPANLNPTKSAGIRLYPPVPPAGFVIVPGSGTVFDLNVPFDSSVSIDLRVDSNNDGRNGFYIATSYEN